MEFYAVRETAFGETPNGSKKFSQGRFTDDTLQHNKETEKSAALRSDRSTKDVLEIGHNTAGNWGFEFCAAEYDGYLEAAFMSSWVAATDVDVPGSLVGQVFTRSSGTFSAAFKRAKLLKISGFATAGNNGIKEVVSCTNTVLTFKAASMVADEAVVTPDMSYRYLRTGVTLYSYLLEKKFTSQDPVYYQAFIATSIEQITLTLEAKKKIVGQIQWMGGQQFDNDGDATAGDGSPTAPAGNPIMVVGKNVGALLWDGAAMPATILSVDLAFKNNLRERPEVGSMFTADFGKGMINFTGTINAYFESKAMYQAFRRHQNKSLVIPLTDSDGRRYLLTYPRLTFNSGPVNDGGQDQDVMLPLEFEALKSDETSEGYVAQLDALDPAA